MADPAVKFQKLDDTPTNGVSKWRGCSDQEYSDLRFKLYRHMYSTEQPMSVVFYWTGSIFSTLLVRSDLWFFLFFTLFVKCLFAYQLLPNSLLVPIDFMDEVSQFLVMLMFFLVFYNGVCFDRFWAQLCLLQEIYTSSMNVSVQTVGLLQAAAATKPEARKSMVKLIRHVNAIYHLGVYTSMREVNWELLEQRRVLQADEIQELQLHFAPEYAVMQWAIAEIHYVKDIAPIPPPIAGSLMNSFQGLLSALGPLDTFIRNPIPKVYFQSLNLFSYCYFVMATVCNFSQGACPDDDSTCIPENNMKQFFGVFVPIMSCLLLRELSILLADPFGDDECDVQVDDYLLRALVNSRALLDSLDRKQLDTADTETEKVEP